MGIKTKALGFEEAGIFVLELKTLNSIDLIRVG